MKSHSMIFSKKQLLSFFFATVFLLSSLVPSVSALSPEQKRAIDINAKYFNTELHSTKFCSGQAGGPTELKGSTIEEKIFNFFIAKGLKPFQAAGIMGNMKAESGLNPRIVEGGGEADYPTNGTGFGLVQWTFTERQQPLVEQAEAAGVKPSDLGIQLEYVMWELNTKYPAINSEFRATTDVEAATWVIEDKYEVHAGPRQPFRVEAARDYLARLGSGSGSGDASSTSKACSKNSKGQVVNGFSLPVDRSWYDSNKEWFTKPHHDYPAADIPVPEGTPIYSMTAGKIIKAPVGGGCGKGVIIDAGNGITFTYCHGSDGGNVNGAREGDTVIPGQVIMNSSYTGNVLPPGPDGTHLHLAIDAGGVAKCPQSLFVGIAEGDPPEVNSLPSGGCTN